MSMTRPGLEQMLSDLVAKRPRITSYHVHENISNHDHARLMIIPCRVQGLKEVVVQRLQDVASNLEKEQNIMSVSHAHFNVKQTPIKFA